MKFNKKSSKMVAFTVALTIIMIFGTILTNSYITFASPSTHKNSSASNDKENEIQTEINTILDIKSQNTYNIAESGSFQVDCNHTLTLNIKSNIKGGTVDLFLFDPNGNEQRVTIGSKNFTKKIKVSKGEWAYNCSGIFREGGKIHITGTIADAKAEDETDGKKRDNSSKDNNEHTKQENDKTIVEIKSQNSYNIAESGSFQVDSKQTLLLSIESNIKGGTVDLFLFDPNGKEQRISIGSKNFTKKIKVTKGEWAYNCSGIYKEGGSIHITGMIKQ